MNRLYLLSEFLHGILQRAQLLLQLRFELVPTVVRDVKHNHTTQDKPEYESDKSSHVWISLASPG